MTKRIQNVLQNFVFGFVKLVQHGFLLGVRVWIDLEAVFFVQEPHPLLPFLAVVEAAWYRVAEFMSEY